MVEYDNQVIRENKMSPGFWLMVVIGLAMLCYGLSRPERVWSAPTWVGFIFMSYLIPQAIFIERSGLARIIEVEQTWFYISLCLLAFWIGFVNGEKRSFSRPVADPIYLIEHQLFVRGGFVLFLGMFSMSSMDQIASATELSSQWTGLITFYYLLFQLIFHAICIFLILYLVTGKPRYFYIMLFGLALALGAIAINAKRSLGAELFFILGICVYFIKGVKVPRTLFVIVMILGTALLHQIGQVRQFVSDDRGTAFQAILTGMPFEQFSYFQPDRAPELTQAIIDIHTVNKNGSYYGPAFIWNRMVHQYVPAFIVGKDLKDNLKFDIDEFYSGQKEFDWFGATRTGFSDSYMGFWYFGIIVFFCIGGIMGWVYRYASQGRLWAIFVYPLILNDSMFAFTESTGRFFSGSFFVVLVALVLFKGRYSTGPVPQRLA